MSRVKSKLSYANVMATIAVFLALGGGAYAAISIPKKSVGAKQLKANAVTTNKIATSAVTATKISSGQVVKGVVAREKVTANQATNAFVEDDVQCSAGEVAIGGGATGTTVGTRNFPNLDIDTDIRVDGPIDANGQAAASGAVATGWHVSAQVMTGPRDVHLYALCAQK